MDGGDIAKIGIESVVAISIIGGGLMAIGSLKSEVKALKEDSAAEKLARVKASEETSAIRERLTRSEGDSKHNLSVSEANGVALRDFRSEVLNEFTRQRSEIVVQFSTLRADTVTTAATLAAATAAAALAAAAAAAAHPPGHFRANTPGSQ